MGLEIYSWFRLEHIRIFQASYVGAEIGMVYMRVGDHAYEPPSHL